MLDQMHQPPAEVVARAYVDAEGYATDVRRLDRRPGRLLGRAGQAGSTGSSPTPASRTPRSPTPTSRSSGSRTASSTSRPTASTATSPTRGDQTAIIWESDDPNVAEHISYRQLHAEVSKFANVLMTMGVRKGDRVVLYLPMIPEAAYAMLACARIGAIHSIVFAGFSADALRSRIEDSGAKLVITADEAPRGGRRTRAEGQRRQGGRRPRRGEAARGAAHRRRGPLGRGARRLAARGDGDRRGRTASRSRSAPRTRSSSSTPPARPASRRASSTPPAAISSTPRSPTSTSSTTTTATSTGAPPTSAGSPATATSSTARWRTARRR